MDTKLTYSLFKLLSVRGVGPVQLSEILKDLLEKGQDVRGIIDDVQMQAQLRPWLTDNQLEQLNKTNDKLEAIIAELAADEVKLVILTGHDYPQRLKTALGKTAPPFLLLKGNLSLLNRKAVGFCGSRNASQRGLEVAKDCAEQLAKKNIVITSGHAAGIDQTTHFEALFSGGLTIIVLPEGLLNFQIRKILKPVWDWDRVLIISEFIPNAIWSTSRAMQRNKTIIGLSDAMILIEAGRNGGSMDAGRKTLALHRRLYIPVYEGMPESAVGNRILLQGGAMELKRTPKTGRANLEHLLTAFSPNSHEFYKAGQQSLDI